MKLSPLQLLVAKHYENGEFAHVDNTRQLHEVGDTLFEFAVREAGDARDTNEYFWMLDAAIRQLSNLQAEIKEAK